MKQTSKKHRSFTILRLALTLGCLIALPVGAADQPKETNKKYPPYPDVWGYELPWPGEDDRNSSINLFKKTDGDYLVRYIPKRVAVKREDGSCCRFGGKYSARSFFGGEKFALSKEDYNEFEARFKAAPMKAYGVHQRIVQQDGRWIELAVDCVGPCCGQFNRYLAKKDQGGKLFGKKQVLCLLDKPLQKPINRRCAENAGFPTDEYTARVVPLGSSLVPVEDGTFLLYDREGNIILRFDGDFQTRSDLLNRKVFVVDHAVLEEIGRDLTRRFAFTDQSFNDAVYEHVLKLRKASGQ